jgi:uncharacterized HhH-GPD family protein
MAKVCLAQEPAADALLERDPLALLVGMLLDQQIPLEKAFKGPLFIAQRMGVETLNAVQIADYDGEEFGKLFATVPAIHRFPGSMAERTQKLARAVADQYDGETQRIWTEAKDGKELFKRLADLPGFGKQKAQIFVALLGKQFGVEPKGWREAAGSYGDKGSFRSVADIVDAGSLLKVREFKKQAKAAAKAGS